MKDRFSLSRFLPRTGGRFILIVLAVVQVVSLLGAIPGVLSLQVNAQFDASQQAVFNRVVPFLILASTAILVSFGWLVTAKARRRLDAWKEGVLKPDPSQELAAWRQITSLASRYGVLSIIVFSLVVILQVLITLSFNQAVTSPFQPNSLLLNGQLQLLLIPDYQPNYYAPAGAPFTLRTVRIGAEGVKALTEAGVTVQTIDEKPAHTFVNTKIGLRWRNIIEGQAFEYTLNYLHTYDFASSAYTVFQFGFPPIFRLTRRAEQIEVIGGTFSKTITEGILIPEFGKGWTLRGELPYILNSSMNFGTDKNIVGTVDVEPAFGRR